MNREKLKPVHVKISCILIHISLHENELTVGSVTTCTAGKVVSESRVTWATSAPIDFLRLSVLDYDANERLCI